MSRVFGAICRSSLAALVASTTALALLALASTQAHAAPYPSDEERPDLVEILVGFRTLWRSSGDDDRHGKVRNAQQLAWNDRLASWINQHATKAQRFRALRDAEYLSAGGSGYDQSISIADGLGERLGELYARGRMSGRLPKTTSLLNTSTGTVGGYITTGAAKDAFQLPAPLSGCDSRSGSRPW